MSSTGTAVKRSYTESGGLRCQWATHESQHRYHDEEWGTPVDDDNVLFEFLCLEGAQAGLSWSTILAKRDGYRKAFHSFDIDKCAEMDEAKTLATQLENKDIVRNKAKIKSVIVNAKVVQSIQREKGSFYKYLYGFLPNEKRIVNRFKTMTELPAKTAIAEAIGKDLKRRGCNFVGPTIMYAFMQAVGMVWDHTTDCFRYNEVESSKNKKQRK